MNIRLSFVALLLCTCSKPEPSPCASGYGRDAAGTCVALAEDDGSGSSSDVGEAGQCGDEADNDRDGLFDCKDSDCIGDPLCGETGQCGDEADNDRDGLFDCNDPDCMDDPLCVEEGSPADSDDPPGSPEDSGTTTERYHPEGYAGVRLHGPDTNNLVEDCMPCHGEDLRGMSGPFPETTINCDDCHRGLEAWRDDCTYCHGGEETEGGAPPREVNGESGASESTYSFKAHTAHVSDSTMKIGFECTECHDQPDNVFTLGHVLLGDTTPDRAEVNFTAGISPEGTWDTSVGTCATLYCHGDGQEDNGEVSEDAAPPTCGECHPYLESSGSAWRGMSGKHRDHLRIDGATCSMCHYQTMGNPDCSDGADCITDTSLHINRVNEVLFQPDLEPVMEWRPETLSCSVGGSACHGSRDWIRHIDGGPPEELVTD